MTSANIDGRNARSIRSRAAILAAAKALWIKPADLLTVTADQIATKAGTSRRTVFRFFPSLKDLIREADPFAQQEVEQ